MHIRFNVLPIGFGFRDGFTGTDFVKEMLKMILKERDDENDFEREKTI